MPDLLIKGIDALTAERIVAFARDHRLTVPQAALELLKLGLREKTESQQHQTAAGAPLGPTGSDMAETRILGGTWNADEAQAFREAIKALEQIPK